MSTFSIDTNQVVECGKRIVSISDDALSNAMTIVENARAELSRYSINVDANIQHIMECLGIQKRNVTSLGASARYIAMHYRMAENAIRINNATVNVYSPDGENSNDNDGSVDIHQRDPMTWYEVIMNLLDQEWITFSGMLSLFMDLSRLLHIGPFELFGEIDFSDLSGLKDQFLQWLYEYIPEHAHDSSIVSVYAILSLINHPSASTIQDHYEQNVEAWEELSYSGYIYSQSLFGTLVYGEYDIANSGCGLVAVYNALYHLNGENVAISMPDIVRSFETNGIALNGAIGTSPLAIDAFFEAEGYDTTMLIGEDITDSSLEDLDRSCDTFIMLTYEDGNDISSNLHYICIVGDETNGYTIYNGGDWNTYGSLEEAVNSYNDSQAEPIAIIGIN